MQGRPYLFYDIETSGLNKCFDQVLQFAAVKTDSELNELERHEILIKLNPDTIPSPWASITHRIGIKELVQGAPEVEAMRTIHQLLNTPNTISVGYNTLGFDDEFLRFSFYRNLLAPYTHQYANQCSRMDLYPMAILYYLFCPDLIQWPEKEGQLNLKLENINALNQLAQGQAHSAIVDVLATVELAKKFKQEAKMWDYVVGYFDKKTEAERMAQLTPAYKNIDARFKEALLIQGKLGSKNFYQAPVLSLGPHLHYKNQSLWLRLDYPDLTQLPKESFAESCYVFRKRCAEPPILLPTLPRFTKYLSPERLEQTHANKEFLAQHQELLNQVCDYHQNYQYPKVENIDLDAALYQRGFPSREEESLNARFHRSPEKQIQSLLDQFLNTQQLHQAVFILARNYPQLLTEEQKKLFETHREKLRSGDEKTLTLDYTSKPRLSIKAALQELDNILQNETLDEQQLELLKELKAYLGSF